MRSGLPTFGRAVYAALWAGLSALAVTLTGEQNLGDLTTLQWVLVSIAALGAIGAVLGLQHKTP